MKKLLFILAIVSCTKQETCYEVDGIWKLSRLVKQSEVVCTYDNSFYYKYGFSDGKVTCVQVRNGVDSFVSKNVVDCNSIYFVTSDSFRYGNPINYAVLVK